MSAGERVVSLPRLRRTAVTLRRRGRRLVLANGVFDVLHVGHLRYLRAARRLGDALVVAVNSDRSTRRLKGPGRPLATAADRARLVAAMAPVDWVTVFDRPDVGHLLRALRPAVHAKGTDYTADTVPEMAVARSLGIAVRIVGDRKRHASRDLITKMRGRKSNVKR